MLRKRLLTALWGLPLLAIIIWFGEPWFTIFIAIWAALAVFEFYRLVANTRAKPLTYFGLAWTLFFIVSRNPEVISTLEPYFDTSLLPPLLLASAVTLSLILLLPYARQKQETVFARWAWTIGGIIYVGWLLSYLVALRGLEDGRNWVFFALLVTFASDSAAFFTGKALGKHKLAPSISPGKTWEGAIGGIIGAIIISLLFILPTPLNLPLSWGQAILLGLLVSIFGQLGDLIESLFKRKMGVKDSGNLIPGHGGVLDRIDSVVLAGIVVYYYVIWVAM